MRTHHQRKRLAVAEFIVAPALEPAEDRMEAQLGMLLELPVDADVARGALSRAISRAPASRIALSRSSRNCSRASGVIRRIQIHMWTD